ncbi:MAG: tRNA lysidine(34) synthetase TilS, partial [Calditrichaeota bacterium]
MLLNKVEKFITTHDLFGKGEKIIVAVSGGMDSVALLHLLLQLRERVPLELGVLHVHHGLRGREADEDLAFTRELAREWGCPFWFQKVQVKEHAAEHKLSLEAAARELRYQAFARTLAETGFHKLATGHTADDQAETLLDHFLRGSGLLGLRGI